MNNTNTTQNVRLDNAFGAGFKWACGAMLAPIVVIGAVAIPVTIIGLATGRLQESMREARNQMENMNFGGNFPNAANFDDEA